MAPPTLLIPIFRQQDVASRVEWLWRERLRGEEEGVETVQGINRFTLSQISDERGWIDVRSDGNPIIGLI